MKTIKKFLLIMIMTLSTMSIYGNEINTPNVNIINDTISNVIVNIPSVIKVFESNDNNTYIRFRSLDKYVLKNINYNIKNNNIYINSKKGLDYINENKIIIYLYTPNKNINFLTDNKGLDILLSLNDKKTSKSVKNGKE